jgi:predicted transcriptional regulator
MLAMNVLEKPAPMPTKLKRISVALDDDAYARLEELAQSSKRSVANMAAVMIEAALFPGGRVVAPREEKRGGRRANAGRKPQVIGDNAVESIAEDSAADADDN